jgi:multidrug efflux system outer membrane protein
VRRVLGIAVAVLLAACTVGPDYVRPTVGTPSTWRIDYPKAADAANTRWWEQFDDPALNALIDTALRENLDIAIAAARVDQFLGNLVATRSQFYPQLGYGGDVSRNRSSRVGQPPVPPGGDPYFTLYQASLSASWQIDLFGRVRRLSEAAQAQTFASEQARRGVVLTIVSGVASSYIGLRGLDRQLEIAIATAQNFQDTVTLFDLRFKGGVISQTELSQVQSQYQQALAAIPALEQQIAAQENLISVLLGRASGPIARGRDIDSLAAPLIPADLPAALLERRPDILQAEQNLVAANANVGATRALYYPTFSLTGVLGLVSAASGDFLSSAASAWSIAAGVTGPIFTFGAIEGQVQTAEAAKREAVLFYQQTILQALRETNDALVGTQKKVQEAQAQTARVNALRDYARLSRLKFDNGVASYLEVLYAENELFAAELAAVRSRAERYTELVNVYKAMGGGWVTLADATTPKPEGWPGLGAGSAGTTRGGAQ